VYHDGKPVGTGNNHLWVKVKNPEDIERFRVAFMVQAAQQGMTWKKPRYSSKNPVKVVGKSLCTIADPSVWTLGRLTFIAKPVADHHFEVKSAEITILGGKSEFFDTSLVELPEKEKVRAITRAAGSEMSVSKSGKSLTISANDLTLDTEIETQHGGVTTVREAFEKGITQKTRCQTPFRESESCAAFLSVNKDGVPFVYDSGTNTTHWLTNSDDNEHRLILAKKTMDTVVELAKDDCGAAFEHRAVEALHVIKTTSPPDYQRYRNQFKKIKGISIVAIDDAVTEHAIDEDKPIETHYSFAKRINDDLTFDGNCPVAYAGSLFNVDTQSCLWVENTSDKIKKTVAQKFDGLKNCDRNSDYKGIADCALSIAENQDFFENAPIGLAGGDSFFTIVDYKLVEEPLTSDHRQRAKLDVAPAYIPIPMFMDFLHQTFKSDVTGEEEQQIALIQEIIGAIIMGFIHKYHKAVLFYDPFGRAGKGTLVEIISALIADEYISAVSPFRWDREYYVATLAGKRANFVGELPDHESIPAAAFKTVTGGDLLTGRHPNFRPFTFKNLAGHVFLSNHFINAKDHSEAFFARWIIIHFRNSLLKSGGMIDPGLAEDIIKNELPGIAYWAFDGAIGILTQGHFSSSIAHDELMAKWRMSINSVFEFIHECCERGNPTEFRISRAKFYNTYKEWCAENQRKPFAKGKVKDLLEHNIKLGISWHRLHGNEQFWGVKLKDSEPSAFGIEHRVGNAKQPDDTKLDEDIY